MVLGSGPIVIGQAAEFDYSGSQACKALREEGVEVVLVNSNPATIQTDVDVADTIYIEPLTPEIVAEIVRRERPDGLLPTMGGQTGLNLAVQLKQMGVLDEVGVKVIGTPIGSIVASEDRKSFSRLMEEIGEPTPRSVEARSVEEAIESIDVLGGYPVLVRPSFCLGGTGSGIARDERELIDVVSKGIELSLNHTVTLDQYLAGWKEFEYEVMRDSADNCITVCNMENVDPMGIHTGDSIVVAPAQTLTDEEHQALRSSSLKVIRALKIEGGCNIQFAVNPRTFEYAVIEVNPRVSRSSALASKATGYPIARVAAKIALGLTLDEIPNRVTGKTPASFEPALDYVVVKVPRWPFDKFREVDPTVGTQMKSTGEVMAIGRTFEEALQKAIRSLDLDIGHGKVADLNELKGLLTDSTDKRIFYIKDALSLGMRIDEVHRLTGIDPWFLHKMKNIVDMERKLEGASLDDENLPELIEDAKRMGLSDEQIVHLLGMGEDYVRGLRKGWGIKPAYKMVDTCAAEFEAETPYYYSTYEDVDEVKVSDNRRKVLIIGSGPIRIGQGIEFDYCCVHAVSALREEGIEAIIINNNPETVSTDFDTSDKLYFEPLTYEDVMNVIEKERPSGVIVQFGGQTPLNLAVRLARSGVNILGTPADNIDIAEDRERFNALLKKLGIPQPEGGTATSVEEAKEIAAGLGYPVLVRPSYVLGGRAMAIIRDEGELEGYMREAVRVSREHPVLIDKFLYPAVEVDVDAVSDGKRVLIGGILEHIEMAGVHSGDAAMVMPPQSLSPEAVETIKRYTRKLVEGLNVIGLINVQYAIKDDIVYVLEVNPRASRTVPFISKAIGIPLVKVATKVMIGHTLDELGLPDEVMIPHVAVKESVFPFVKLPGVDPVLGPEMKSTGEVMGIDSDFGRAYYKSQAAAGMELPVEGTAFFSVMEDLQERIKPIAKEFYELGFEILATSETARAISDLGIPVGVVKGVGEGEPNIIDYIRNGKVNLIVNIPRIGGGSPGSGYWIRKAALDFGVPYITTTASALAAARAIKGVKAGAISIRSLNEYHAMTLVRNGITVKYPR